MKTNVAQLLENNKVTVIGEVIENFAFDHAVNGESFYRTKISVDRFSDNSDEIVVVISEKLVDVTSDPVGAYIKVEGQYRSYNKKAEDKTRLILFVFAREIEQLEVLPTPDECNNIRLEGTLCKKPIHRKTPLGNLITDISLAVNRCYGKSDYIPCISWRDTAVEMADLNVGDKIKIYGRIQSRLYNKKISDDQIEERTAYEVSINKFELLQKAEEKVAVNE